MPHPEFLRKLVDEYETALAEESVTAAGVRNTRAQDLAYTLCVSTGTRDVGPALEAARRMLAAAGTDIGARVTARREQVPARRDREPTAAAMTA
ncbi:DUF5133 domain-containing protein [Streptomyces sp. NPDC015220]|uniref:DUF5133 domain-containing protein n=1 Tax=Streptomyces sp. NPDC015220 TaxID=3364947 RepID=UPI0036FB132F